MHCSLRLAAAFALVSAAAAQDHFYFHPEGASFAARCSDVPAALEALDKSVYGQLLRDPGALGLIAYLDGKESVTRDEIIRTVDMEGFGKGVAAASISVSAKDNDLVGLLQSLVESADPAAALSESAYVRIALDFTTEERAVAWRETVAGLAAYWGLEAIPEPAQPSSMELTGLGDGEASVSRYKLAEGVDTVGVLSNIASGRRAVMTLGTQGVLPPEQRGGENEIFSGPVEALLDVHLNRGLSDLLQDEVPIGFPLLGEFFKPALSPFFGWALDGGRLSIDAADGAFRTVRTAGPGQHRFANLLGAQPLAEGAIGMIHPSSEVAYAATFDSVVILNGAPPEAMVRVFGALGDTVGFEIQPLKGLATAPPTYLHFTLQNREQLLHAIPALEDELRGGFGSAAEFVRSEYRGARLFTLTLRMSSGIITSALGVRPTLVVLEDRAFLCASEAMAKRRIRQLAETEIHPGLASVAAPTGASVVSYGDWGTLVAEAYGHGLDLGPIAAQGMQELFGVPVDLEKLPPPSLFSGLSSPSWAWVKPGTDGARSEARTTYGPFDAAMIFGLVFGFQRSSTQRVTVPASERAGSALARAQAKLTDARLESLRNLVLEYALNHGSAPVSVDALIQAFPDRFTGGAQEALDAWGNKIYYGRTADFEFRLWSAGANQVDEQGAGDDVLVESL